MKKIIKSFSDASMSTDPTLVGAMVVQQYNSVTPQVLEYVNSLVTKNCAVVFSGGQKLPVATAYVEYKHYKDLGLPLDPTSLFVDKNNTQLVKLVLDKLTVSTLVFLHSPEFSYLSLEEITKSIGYYKQHTGKQIIVAVSLFNICFNRLSTNIEYLEKYLNGKLIDKSIVICL